MKLDLVVSGYLIHENKILLIKHKKLGLWLPPGGHIERNESPDDALKREFLEELNLEIELIDRPDIPTLGRVKGNLSTPFYVNIHNVGDHDHCCFFYLCKCKNLDRIIPNPKENLGYKWFSEKDLDVGGVPPDVKTVGLIILNRSFISSSGTM